MDRLPASMSWENRTTCRMDRLYGKTSFRMVSENEVTHVRNFLAIANRDVDRLANACQLLPFCAQRPQRFWQRGDAEVTPFLAAMTLVDRRQPSHLAVCEVGLVEMQEVVTDRVVQ